jgi:hypothetical protein
MVGAATTTSKIAMVASKIMLRQTTQRRCASAVSVGGAVAAASASSPLSPSMMMNNNRRSDNNGQQQPRKEQYHGNNSMANAMSNSPYNRPQIQKYHHHPTNNTVTVESVDKYLGNLLGGFCNGSCETEQQKRVKSNKEYSTTATTAGVVSAEQHAKMVANMIMMRKELLLLHQLLDTLYTGAH